jgi:hypothetical protein
MDSCIASESVGCAKIIDRRLSLWPPGDGRCQTLDLFSDLLANHMRAQQLAGFSIENRLYKTLRLAAGQRLTIPDKRTYRS